MAQPPLRPAAAAVLSQVLSANLPDSFFHGPTPFESGDGYTVQVLSSVQVSPAAAAAAAATVACMLHACSCLAGSVSL